MLLTICTIHQLPQALALGHSYTQFDAGHVSLESVLIGLADDPAHLPTDFVSPYPILPISEILPEEALQTLSAGYTPTEFAAACKPLFVAESFRRYPDAEIVIYADPSIYFLRPPISLFDEIAEATLALTPFVTRSPAPSDSLVGAWPDEKFFQNIGLYSSDFLLFRRSQETDRMLAWWDNRVRERAYINFCAGLCLDQIWLMHVPIFFKRTHIVKNPGWHVGLWNLAERMLRSEPDGWYVDGATGQHQPLQFINFKGLLNPDEGFFPHQNRVNLAKRTDVLALLNAYRQQLIPYKTPTLALISPAYGQQPEPVVLRGWRYATVRSMRAVTHFVDHVYLPVIR